MSERKVPTINADEADAFSRRWRKLVYWQRGELKRIKRGYAKRVRRSARESLRHGSDDV